MSTRPAWAGQQTDTIPPGTLTLGPVRISPSVVLKDAGVDNNVFNEASNPKQDWTFTLVPAATINMRVRRIKLNYVASTDYVYLPPVHH